MEAYKSTCPDCKAVYFWTGFKTGLGKTPEQLEQMKRDETVCKKCGSTRLKTELDMESEAGRDMQEVYKLAFIAAEDILRRNECPVCHEPAVVTCRCPLSDSKCKNGHEWHWCPVHRVVVMGASDHTGDTFRCRCGRGDNPKKDDGKENPWTAVRRMDAEMDKLETHQSGQCEPFLFDP